MKFIDSHTHIYLSDFASDIGSVIDRAEDDGVKKYFFPAIDSSHHEEMLALEKKYQAKCFAMMGLHPCSVKENYKEELKIVEDWLSRRTFVAIGEIGLDFYWDTTYTKQQFEAFELQMQWALDKNLPIVIHTRNAIQEAIELVLPYSKKGLTGIFHCYGDDLITANKIIDMNFYLGIGGVVTYKNTGLNEVLKQIPLSSIVLETDAPYLTPVPYRGKRNEPAYIKIIAEQIARIKDVSIVEVARVTTSNAEKIFKC
ncbi:MAG: TatD family hydrolase [Chitinophagaceae bacterium]|nr:TatD family hydrolase [Chitinophagaceae bacterium]